MRVPLKWLRDYVALTLPESEIAHRLTMAGLEVTAVERSGSSWENIFVGEVTNVSPHPNADRLRVATVSLGNEEHTVVCGAPNVAAGQKIAFAKLGADILDGHSGKPTKLKPAKIRGVESAGMVCSEKELGLSDEHQGILVLAEDARVGTPFADYYGETVLEIDMKPNRADGLSVLGVARDVAALTDTEVREPDLDYTASGSPVDQLAKVLIEDPDLCPRYTATVIENVRIEPSPPWMQARLTAAGMRPINNVVDIANYVMLELGQPIHAFDYDTLADHTIIVRRARPGEKMTTLDGVDHVFGSEHLLITDPKGPVAVAGVMGGRATEVTEKTKTILLEVATFDPLSIRRTALALKVPSEASRRFAWGLPTELAPIASRRATKLLVEIGGGRAASGIVDAYPVPRTETRIEVRRKRLGQVLGIEVTDKQVEDTLRSLGFGVRAKPDGWQVRPPYWRRDVRIPDDVAEEIARIVGYELIPIEPLTGSIPPRVTEPRRELRETVRDVLAASGMQEIITYPLTSRQVLERVLPFERLARAEPLAVVNPLNVGEECLRTSLRGSVLSTVAANQRLQPEAFAVFETSRVYLPGGELPEEVEHLVGAVTGRRTDRWGRATDAGVDFFDAKGYLERLFDRLGVSVSYADLEEFGMIPGRTAELRLEGTSIGCLGQVHPSTASAFGLDQDVYLFEVSLDALLPYVSSVRHYRPISRFPPVVEDLAVVVGQSVPAARVRDVILEHPLVSSVELFDEYVGDPVPSGKKSLAFSVCYQAPDRTLTEKEVGRARERIVGALRKDLGAELRGV
ncbi:MAG: phenylalanine--tRNA ligase subunit beta [Vicinamibacteria bacterium]